MAQHNISCRLTRSLNAYLRCSCLRYGSLPYLVRNYHGRDDDGFEPDDKHKKGKQSRDKVKNSAAGSTLRIHRCDKDKIIPHTTEATAGYTKIGAVTADCESGRAAKCGLEKPKGFANIDLTRFEKTCEENNTYIRHLLNGTEVNENISAKADASLSDIQGLKIPSHEDVQRERVNQEALVKDMKPYAAVQESKSSPKVQELSTYSTQDEDLEKHVSSFKAQRLDLKDEVTPDNPRNSESSQTSEVPQFQSAISETKTDCSQKETTKSSVSESTKMLADTAEPYVFPINNENLYDRMTTAKERSEQSSGENKNKVDKEKGRTHYSQIDGWTKLKESEFSAPSSNEASDAIANASRKGPLKGTVAVLLEANSRTRTDREVSFLDDGQTGDKGTTSGEIQITSLGESEIFGDRTGHVKNIESRDGKYVADSKSKTKKSKSTKSKSVDIERLDGEFDKTLGSQIFAEFGSSNESQSKLSPSNPAYRGEEHNTTANEMNELKSISANSYKISSITSDPDSKHEIKSKNELTPGELYHTDSECVVDNDYSLKASQFQTETRNKTANKLGRRQRNIQQKNDFKSENISEFGTQERQPTAETHLTPGELYNSNNEGDEKRTFTRNRPKRSLKKHKDIESKLEGLEERLRENSTNETEAKNNSESHKNRKAKYDSETTNEIDLASTSQDKNRLSEEPQSRSRGENDEESLRHAKLYISKAKRLNKLAKKRCDERKSRMRSRQKPKKSKKSSKSNEKMSLTDFLYGLVTNKNKKGGGNQRNFTTHSAARCSFPVSPSWPLQRLKVQHYIEAFKSKSDVFISPQLKKQGLGADNITKERKRNEEKRKKNKSEEKDSRNQMFSSLEPKNERERNRVNFITDENHTTIQGGSLREQIQNRRLNRIKINDEEFDIQVRGASQELKKPPPTNELKNDNHKRNFNIFENIWQGIRFPQNSLASKIEGCGQLTAGLYRGEQDVNNI